MTTPENSQQNQQLVAAPITNVNAESGEIQIGANCILTVGRDGSLRVSNGYQGTMQALPAICAGNANCWTSPMREAGYTLVNSVWTLMQDRAPDPAAWLYKYRWLNRVRNLHPLVVNRLLAMRAGLDALRAATPKLHSAATWALVLSGAAQEDLTNYNTDPVGTWRQYMLDRGLTADTWEWILQQPAAVITSILARLAGPHESGKPSLDVAQINLLADTGIIIRSHLQCYLAAAALLDLFPGGQDKDLAVAAIRWVAARFADRGKVTVATVARQVDESLDCLKALLAAGDSIGAATILNVGK